MPSKNVILSALLGATKGGTEGYTNERNKQKEFALKKLDMVPSSIQELRTVNPNFDTLTADEQQTALLNLKAAGSGYAYTTPKSKESVNPPGAGTQASDFQKNVDAIKVQMRKNNPGMSEADLEVAARDAAKRLGKSDDFGDIK